MPFQSRPPIQTTTTDPHLTPSYPTLPEFSSKPSQAIILTTYVHQKKTAQRRGKKKKKNSSHDSFSQRERIPISVNRTRTPLIFFSQTAALPFAATHRFDIASRAVSAYQQSTFNGYVSIERALHFYFSLFRFVAGVGVWGV